MSALAQFDFQGEHVNVLEISEAQFIRDFIEGAEDGGIIFITCSSK